MKKLTKIFTGLLATLTLVTLKPIQANAEWKQDNNGKYYQAGVERLTGWHAIDGNFYCFNTSGYMLTNTTIEGMSIGADGKCVINNSIQNVAASKILPYEVTKSYSKGYNQIYNNIGWSKNEKFTMSGNQYSEGFTLFREGYALFNLNGKYNNIKFKAGHIDGSSNKDVELIIYLDGKESKRVKLECDTGEKIFDIPVNKALQMKFQLKEIDGTYNEKYGFTDIIGY